MSLLIRAPRAATPPARVERDAGIDLVRVGLLGIVFVLHGLMVGVSVGADGPVLENALEHWAGFAPVSWLAQIMPLFFVVGGFASLSQWRSRSSSPTEYIRGRLDRLLRPALIFVAVMGVALIGLAVMALDPELSAIAGFRIGQPLWFLAVYLGCSALVPIMVRAHDRWGVAVPVALAAVVALVDVLRLTSGVEGIGFVNLAAVWLLMQQLGFFLAEGRIDRLSRRVRVGAILVALATLLLLTTIGPYSADMYVNLNPPTLCLVLLGIAQLAALSLGRESLRRVANGARARRVVSLVGPRAMTVYLWHMPVFVASAGVLLLLNQEWGLALPEPLSASWWLTRPVWLLATATVVAALVAVVARAETAPRPTRIGADRWIALDAGAAVLGVGLLLVVGVSVATTPIVALLLWGSYVGWHRVVSVVRDGAVRFSSRVE